jgi:hypothetical protein
MGKPLKVTATDLDSARRQLEKELDRIFPEFLPASLHANTFICA